MGHEAEHAGDIGMQSAADGGIWAYVLSRSAVIVTKDHDFSVRRTLARVGPQVVWIRVPNVQRRDLLTWFEPALPPVVVALKRRETLIEVA